MFEIYRFDELAHNIIVATRYACDLIYEHVAGVLPEGEMLSHKLQTGYINCNYEKKSKKVKKMRQYIQEVNKMHASPACKLSKRKDIIKNYFDDIDVSPMFLSRNIPYIPSFKNLLENGVDRKVYSYVQRRTPGECNWADIPGC